MNCNKLFETLSFHGYLSFFDASLCISNYGDLKLQKIFCKITNTASKPIIVTLFIAIEIPNNFLQQMNTKTSSTDDKQ